MYRKILIASIISVLSLSFVLIAGEKDHRKGHGGKHKGGGHAHDSNYTLKQVMQHLGKAQEQIHLGLLMNNRLLIKSGAEAIGNHPHPKGGIKPYITKKMDKNTSMKTVKSMDSVVHGVSLEMAKVATTASMIELNQMNNKMTNACITCHNVFRD